MSESLPQPSESQPTNGQLFMEQINVALDATAAIGTSLSRLAADNRPKTIEQIEEITGVADQLWQLAEFLGISDKH
jgi:anaerobic selenocysteine-containing dehydrogenase